MAKSLGKDISMSALGIREITQEDERTLAIHWSTGTKKNYDTVELRKQCPCALCVDEKTGRRTLDEKSISEKTRPLHIKSVGNYALTIHFDDGHKTGLYTYDSLLKMA